MPLYRGLRGRPDFDRSNFHGLGFGTVALTTPELAADPHVLILPVLNDESTPTSQRFDRWIISRAPACCRRAIGTFNFSTVPHKPKAALRVILLKSFRGTIMSDADQDPRCIKMYEDFLAQTEPAELSKQLEPLEAAIAERRKELEGATDANQELLSIEEALERILETKIEKLGFHQTPSEVEPIS
jgi:hypothetical protein